MPHPSTSSSSSVVVNVNNITSLSHKNFLMLLFYGWLALNIVIVSSSSSSSNSHSNTLRVAVFAASSSSSTPSPSGSKSSSSSSSSSSSTPPLVFSSPLYDNIDIEDDDATAAATPPSDWWYIEPYNARGIPIPFQRYIAWHNLSPSQIELAVLLGYDEESWNMPGRNNIERLSYKSLSNPAKHVINKLFSSTTTDGSDDDSNDNNGTGSTHSQQVTTTSTNNIAFHENDNKNSTGGAEVASSSSASSSSSSHSLVQRQWDCYVNHYRHSTWDELRDVHNVRYNVRALGWTYSMWTKATTKAQKQQQQQQQQQQKQQHQNHQNLVRAQPECYDEYWDELSIEQKSNATELCYFSQLWDEQSLVIWGFEKVEVEPAAVSSSGSVSGSSDKGSDDVESHEKDIDIENGGEHQQQFSDESSSTMDTLYALANPSSVGSILLSFCLLVVPTFVLI